LNGVNPWSELVAASDDQGVVTSAIVVLRKPVLHCAGLFFILLKKGTISVPSVFRKKLFSF